MRETDRLNRLKDNFMTIPMTPPSLASTRLLPPHNRSSCLKVKPHPPGTEWLGHLHSGFWECPCTTLILSLLFWTVGEPRGSARGLLRNDFHGKYLPGLDPMEKSAGGGCACSCGLLSSLLQGHLCLTPHLYSGLGLSHKGDLRLTQIQNWIPWGLIEGFGPTQTSWKQVDGIPLFNAWTWSHLKCKLFSRHWPWSHDQSRQQPLPSWISQGHTDTLDIRVHSFSIIGAVTSSWPPLDIHDYQ